jgi:hypothetical protein
MRTIALRIDLEIEGKVKKIISSSLSPLSLLNHSSLVVLHYFLLQSVNPPKASPTHKKVTQGDNHENGDAEDIAGDRPFPGPEAQ